MAEDEGANDTSEVEGLEACAETLLVNCQECQEEASVSPKLIYNTIVHWRKRFFPVPNGSAGSDFVKELTRSLQQYIDAKGDHGDALFSFFSLPSLMLQRSSEHCKTKDDVKTLRQQLDLWQHGDLCALLDEGQCLQDHIDQRSTQARLKQPTDEALSFSRLVTRGKVQEAIRSLGGTGTHIGII